ncbi:MAG: flagellar hook-associated protein FlgK [Pseudomonadota bacterium]
MYGLTSTLRTAVTGLQVSQDGIGSTANNIANAHTKGYTRKVVEQEAQHVQGLGAGVRSVEIARRVDQFIEGQLRVQAGLTGRTGTLENYFERIQGLVFGDPSNTDTGLGPALDQLADRIEVAANNPEKSAQRMGIIGAAQDTFLELGRAEANTQDLRQDADRRIDNLVERVNVTLEAIHSLNAQIARSQNPGELLDQRDLLVGELAGQIEITTHMIDDNRIAIYGPSGEPLLEYTPRILEYKPAATVTKDTLFENIRVYTRDPATEAKDPTSGVVFEAAGDPNLKGELGALLHARDKVLPELSDQLREFGRMLTFALNEAHNTATALPPPAALTGSRVDFSDPPTFAGTAYVALVDGSGDVTGTFELDLDAAGFDTAATAADFAAEITAQLGPDVTASAVDGALRLESVGGEGLVIANGTASVSVADEGRDRQFGFSHYFGLNDFVTEASDDPTQLSVRADIVDQPMALASAVLDVDPADLGATTLGGVGDNRGVQALAAALDRPVTAIAQGGLPETKVSMRNYLADIVGYQAVRAEQAGRAAANDRILSEELEFRKSSVSGVNVDEEMAHLMVLQQSYSASARIITIADRLLDELLSIKR